MKFKLLAIISFVLIQYSHLKYNSNLDPLPTVTNYYDYHGMYQGYTFQHGNSIEFFNKKGEYSGRMQINPDGTNQYFNSKGQYKGYSYPQK